MSAPSRYRQHPSSPTPSDGSTLVGSPHSFASSATLVNPSVGYPTPPNSYKSLGGFTPGQPPFQLHGLLVERTQFQYDVRYGASHLPRGPYGIDAVAVDWPNGQIPHNFTITVHNKICINISTRPHGPALTVRDILEGVTQGLRERLTSQERSLYGAARATKDTLRMDMLDGHFMFAGLRPIGPSSAAMYLW